MSVSDKIHKDDDSQIDENVLDRLLTYVSLSSVNLKSQNTKQVTVFQGCFHQTSTFRTSILTRVLNSGGKASFQMLQKYLQKAEEHLQAIPNSEQVRCELHTIVMLSIEEMFWFRKESNLSRQNAANLELLEELIEELSSIRMDFKNIIAKLTSIAKVRFILEDITWALNVLRSITFNFSINFWFRFLSSSSLKFLKSFFI